MNALAARVSTTLGALAALGLLLMLGHILASAGARLVTGEPLPGTIEIVSEWWMPVVCLLALGLAQLRDEHIGVTMLTGALRGDVRRRVLLTGRLVALVPVVAVLLLGLYSALDAFHIRERVVGAISVPVWPVAFVLPVAAAALTLQLLWPREDAPTAGTGEVAEPADVPTDLAVKETP